VREKIRTGAGDVGPSTGCGFVAAKTETILTESPRRPQALNWRDHLDVHPAAEMFPLLSETDPDALKELAEDIRQHGQREPASYIKDSDGNRVLLDGRNRLDALEMLGRKIDINDSSMFEQRSRSINAQAFIISKNIHRRHLTPEKKRDLIGLLLKANPEKSDRQIAKTVKASHHTVEAVRAKLESTGQIAQLKKTVGADGKARSRPAAKAKPQNDRPAWATEVLDLVAKGKDCFQQAESIRESHPDCNGTGVSQVSTAPEKLPSGLPTGSDSSKNPVQQAEIAETKTQPENPIIAAWRASTLPQREEFIEDYGDFIADWSATRKAREKDAPPRYRVWNSCIGIETGVDDADEESEHWHAEYESLADQLSELERTIEDFYTENKEEGAEQTTPDEVWASPTI
jgi:ParB-like chromosome segregation protein Spo0J